MAEVAVAMTARRTAFNGNAVRSHFTQRLDATAMSRLDEMLRFLEQDPNDSFARYAVALELRSQKRIDEAIAQLDELRRRDPSYGATYYQLGELHAMQGDVDRAEEAFRAGIDVARAAGDTHTRSELEAALDDLDALR